MRNLSNQRSAIGKRLHHLGRVIKTTPPLLSRAKQLIFLCGANIEHNRPSHRRETIKGFLKSISEDYCVIYAESVFSELRKIGHRKNALDLEHRISELADRIVIILESESAYCELGAFANESLRKKLIVINDIEFKDSESFINTGPIAALKEVESPILWYPMSKIIKKNTDGIGTIFHDLKIAIQSNTTSRSQRINRDISDLKPDTISLYFVHDFVLIAGPVSYKELIDIFTVTFGTKRYDLLSSLLGVLRAAGLVISRQINEVPIYQSVSLEPFLNYGIKIASLMAAFRNYHLINTPERFDFG